MTEIRYAALSDREWWFSLDKHLPEEEFENKVRTKRVLILTLDRRPVGLLRYHLFWDSIPFCSLLMVEPDCRGMGFGRQLMEHWEGEMKALGHGILLTSTQADESAQHFYRKLGYEDCGCLMLQAPRYAQPMELFLSKAI